MVVVSLPVLIAMVWVGLTWRTGLTYHFMPLVVAASGAAIARWLNSSALPRAITAGYASWSLLVVAFAWSLMVTGEFDPAGTFVADQPGGVVGEVVAFSLLGALGSARYALHR